jgi:hypothetical protein
MEDEPPITPHPPSYLGNFWPRKYPSGQVWAQSDRLAAQTLAKPALTKRVSSIFQLHGFFLE